jgi:hypothetical protein
MDGINEAGLSEGFVSITDKEAVSLLPDFPSGHLLY